eukprot:902805-Rhodomonas_salina.3
MKQQKKAAQPEPGVNILPDSKPAPKPQQAAAQDDTARNLAMSTSVGVHDSNLVPSLLSRCPRSAISGTNNAAHCAISAYATSGTDIAYGPTRLSSSGRSVPSLRYYCPT